MAAFSRLQLAAALIEYDNDSSDPNKPRRSAHDSAIFAPLRRNNGTRGPIASRKSTDYLGVSIPSETGSIGGRDSVAETRRSRGSSDALRNPFGRDSTYEGLLEEDEEEEMEVDLASWGLDAIIPKEKGTKSSRKKEKSVTLPNPHLQSPTTPGASSAPARRRLANTRSMSLGGLDSFGEGGAFLDAQSAAPGERRHSFGSPLDLPEARSPQPMPHSRRRSTHTLIESIPVTPPLHSVPFPSGASARSVSPLPESSASQLDPGKRARAYSSASFGYRYTSTVQQEDDLFSVRPPSPDRASRFDPKVARPRAVSSNTLGTSAPLTEEPNPFTLRPPSPSRSSRFDPKAVRPRTVSNYSLGTQMMLNDDDVAASFVEEEPKERRRLYSRSELMRPNLLIMPSPLQGSAPPPPPPPQTVQRDGFLVTTDGPPLPAGAKSGNRRSISAMSLLDPSPSPPVASNSFTPNPRMSLTLSQLTFRNTLSVDGVRDVAYFDMDNLPRATEDGEQVQPDPTPEIEEPPKSPPPPPPPVVVIDDSKSKRPAGKLFGKSLIDDLEARKAEIRGKQRVFTGDQRPSMMARSSTQRSSTLIDPESLKQRPQSQRMSSYQSQPDLARRNSGNIKPLLEFEDEIPGAPGQLLSANQGGLVASRARSVFGVDTLWEREMAKLKQVEEQERAEAEERKKLEAEAEAKRQKKGKGRKKKGKHKSVHDEPEENVNVVHSSPGPEHTAPSPPVLPMIERATVRRVPPPPMDDDDDDEESDTSEVIKPSGSRAVQAESWFAGASDEEDAPKGPIRATGSGPRYPERGNTAVVQPMPLDDDSSEEDVPLVATIGRAAERMTRMNLRTNDDDSDEEKPLSILLDKTKALLPSSNGSISRFDPRSPVATADDDDDDDKPLGLQVPRIATSSQAYNSNVDEDEDDKPLALHPEQLRKSQYFFAQQQQQQQQQMMFQAQAAQLHQSMIFGTPSMMASGFFGPPMAPPMMIPPQLAGTPPPLADTVKFGRIDNWRHDVAVEGQR